jgi:uncharacterized ion transporter superfamily protein YfcC
VKRLPHPLILLLGGVIVAAILTWLLPAGEYARRDDPATHRSVVVAGTYHAVPPAPVGPFAAAIAVPRGFIEAADVIAVVLFVGGAWIVVDKLGTLSRVVAALVGTFRQRGLIAIPVIALFFATMGALENMQEEIIPLVPVLLALGAGLGIDAVSVVAMSAGAAMIGSAFGPTNPFQAGIAMKLAQVNPSNALAIRLGMFVVAFGVWVAWTMRHAARERARAALAEASLGTVEAGVVVAGGERIVSGANGASAAGVSRRDLLVLAIVLAPMAAYVYGSTAAGWGFNELSAIFFVAGIVAGFVGGLGAAGTIAAYLEGMQVLLPAAMLIGVARSISLVLADGHVIDTILQGLAAPLAHAPPFAAALLMIPVHAIVHVAVPSVSGQAVLTMPVFVPLADLLGVTRQTTVTAFQMGGGLCELVTPTNGALMAILLAARVPYGRWVKFAAVGALIVVTVGILGMFAGV